MKMPAVVPVMISTGAPPHDGQESCPQGRDLPTRAAETRERRMEHPGRNFHRHQSNWHSAHARFIRQIAFARKFRMDRTLMRNRVGELPVRCALRTARRWDGQSFRKDACRGPCVFKLRQSAAIVQMPSMAEKKPTLDYATLKHSNRFWHWLDTAFLAAIILLIWLIVLPAVN